MSSNVGLSTPRGSGTSGYVQRNLSQLKHKDNIAPYPKDFDSIKEHRRKADQKILAHNKARELEVQVFDLRDKLEDEGYQSIPCSLEGFLLTMFPRIDEEEIETQVEALRKKLTTASSASEGSARPAKGLKVHQVHEREVAKGEESERLIKALGIRVDYEEGSHWKRQEERLRDSVLEKDQNQEKGSNPR